MTWADAMGLIVLEGLVILVLVLTGFRKAVFHAVPTELKIAISVGIGLFIALIGFVDAGFVRRTRASARSPSRSVRPATSRAGRCWSSASAWCLVISLWVLKVRGAILISIVVTTILAIIVEAIADIGPFVGADGTVNPHGWNLNVPAWPRRHHSDNLTSAPLGEFNLLGVVRGDRRRRGAAADLHADAGRLLRHHGHDDGHRRGGGPPTRKARRPTPSGS